MGAMTANRQQRPVPKLRFPEFRNQPEWNLLTLSSVSDVNPRNNGLPEQFIYIDLEAVKNGVLVERKEISRDAAPSRAQRRLSRKDIIFQTVRPYQRNNLFFDIDDGYEYVASTGYAQLRAHESPEFLYQLLHTDSFVSSVLARCTGSNYPAINPSALASIGVLLPRKAEQQKIAECLGSLDTLIAAEDRKIEALRQHKQGLLQQLFPKPGETAPKLRFPEFKDIQGWSVCSLTNVVRSISSGLSVPQTYDNNGFRVTRIETIADGTVDINRVGRVTTEQDISSYRLRIGDILISNINSISHIGKSVFIDRDYDLYHGMNLLRIKALSDVISSRFLHYWLNTAIVLNSIRSRANKAVNQASINQTELGKTVVLLPQLTEQRKIAVCLSSMDDLIAAAGRKIEVLRQHKKGLMQQLFPCLETK